MVLKISDDTPQGGIIPSASAMSSPLLLRVLLPSQTLPHGVIEFYTSSARVIFQQYGSPRLFMSPREFVSYHPRHCTLICYMDSSQKYVAVKICVADGDPEQERHIFRQLSEHKSMTTNVVQLRDSFDLEGPNGVHTVLVYDVLGSLFSFLHLTGGYKHTKMLCHQVVCGLAALHRLGIVHGGKCMIRPVNATMNDNGHLDLHAGNVGIALPTLNEHPPSDILNYFGHPHCNIIVPSVEPARPQALPPYLVHSIPVDDYMAKDPKFMEGLLRAEILDLGNG